jgi:hypothetical protein
VYRRACNVSFNFVTAKKRHEVARLLEAYRGAVNFYIRSLWAAPGRLDGETLGRLTGACSNGSGNWPKITE